jgi:hypothetical protein
LQVLLSLQPQHKWGDSCTYQPVCFSNTSPFSFFELLLNKRTQLSLNLHPLLSFHILSVPTTMLVWIYGRYEECPSMKIDGSLPPPLVLLNSHNWKVPFNQLSFLIMNLAFLMSGPGTWSCLCTLFLRVHRLCLLACFLDWPFWFLFHFVQILVPFQSAVILSKLKGRKFRRGVIFFHIYPCWIFCSYNSVL